jgi:hypothetical protein|tara:strand:- start:206 stop:508 length:303 start_codon:yes stop_codon:yes gene_type:complete
MSIDVLTANYQLLLEENERIEAAYKSFTGMSSHMQAAYSAIEAFKFSMEKRDPTDPSWADGCIHRAGIALRKGKTATAAYQLVDALEALVNESTPTKKIY